MYAHLYCSCFRKGQVWIRGKSERSIGLSRKEWKMKQIGMENGGEWNGKWTSVKKSGDCRVRQVKDAPQNHTTNLPVGKQFNEQMSLKPSSGNYDQQ